MSNMVSAEWLRERLAGTGIAIADCRFTMGQPSAGKEEYDNGHLPGAVYFDLERDLSDSIGTHGGRHPLPDPQKLAGKLGNAGIDETVAVVAYDDQGGAMAARFWWILKYYGHDQVYVLSGGYAGWRRLGYEIVKDVPSPVRRTFIPKLRHDRLLNARQVKERLGQPDTALVDSREARRYLGLEEPIDRVAGHIPGARNYFWKDAFTPDGRLKDQTGLSRHFQGLDASQEVVVYCGSGVTACPNILALTENGFTNVKLYGGSWSDWISYPDHPIETG